VVVRESIGSNLPNPILEKQKTESGLWKDYPGEDDCSPVGGLCPLLRLSVKPFE